MILHLKPNTKSAILLSIMVDKHFDFVIIGGGVAGLTAAQYGARANLSTAVIEAASNGGQSLLINDLENYPGVFPAISGYELIDAMVKQAKSFGAEFITATVKSLEKKESGFELATTKGIIAAKAVLLATGAKHRHLNIDGEEKLIGKGVSYCASCDGPFFRNKRISVIGGGDAAFDEATFLSNLTDKVYLIHRREAFRAQAAVAERVMNNPKIEKMLNKIPVKINGTEKVESIVLKDVKTGEEIVHETDAVFVFVGMDPQTELVDFVQKDSSGYVVTDENMETSVKGLFCAGDVRAKPFRQIVTAAADGAYAAHSAEKYIRGE